MSRSLAAVNGEIIDSAAIFVWACRECSRKKVTALIQEQADDKAAIAAADKPKRLAALRADLLAIERFECAAIKAANTDDYRAIRPARHPRTWRTNFRLHATNLIW